MPTDAQRLIYAVRSRKYDRLSDLMRNPKNVSIRTDGGRTALHAAAEEGDLKAARIILEAGAHVNARMKTGQTPLHLASAYGQGCDMMDPDIDRRDPCRTRRHQPVNLEVAKVLTEIIKETDPRIPADLDVQSEIPQENKADVFMAALNHFTDLSRLYREISARGINVDQVDPDFAELLRGNPRYVRMAELLLEHGADLHAADESGRLPLHEAVEYGSAEMVRLLLERGASPDQRNADEPSFVDLALDRSRTDIANALLEYRAEFTPNNSYQLHNAAGGGRTTTMLWLLDRGADINLRDSEGDTPLLTAASCGHQENVLCLVRRGADLKVRNSRGDNLLYAASSWRACLEPLLAFNLPVNDQNSEGRTPLHRAAQSGDWLTIQILLDAGADTDIQDQEGNTPLHVIFLSDECRPDVEFPIFLTLVAGGADRSIKNKEGRTAFDCATQWDYPEEYLQLLNPNPEALRIARSFIWLGLEKYKDFLPKALISIEVDGKVWPSSEHYFHAQKTDVAQVREHIRHAATAQDAVCRLRESKAKLSRSWQQRCDTVMRSALLTKFKQHDLLRESLLNTHDATLVSDSYCDWYWVENRNAPFNAVGKMLMSIRSELKH